MRMQGRIVLITGATGGLGTAITKRWLTEGAKVVAVGSSEASLARLTEQIGTSPNLAMVAADVTSESGAEHVAAFAKQTFGQAADTLLSLVGGFAMGKADAKDAPDVWDKMRKLNLDSAFYSVRAVLPAMKEAERGWICGIGSRAATQPGANLSAYAASKAALAAYFAAVAVEVRDAGIHVNLISTSTIDTPANRDAMGEKAAHKWVSPDELAEATLYLCSEAASGVYGATLAVYGRV